MNWHGSIPRGNARIFASGTAASRPRSPVVRRAAAVRRGAMAASMGLSAAGLLGMLGLAGMHGTTQRQHDSLRDAAQRGAVAGAAALQAGLDVASHVHAAIDRDAGGQISVTVNMPPREGPHAKRSDAVEVIIAERRSLGMARIALGAVPEIRSRAVAIMSGEVDPAMCPAGSRNPADCIILASAPLPRTAPRAE